MSDQNQNNDQQLNSTESQGIPSVVGKKTNKSTKKAGFMLLLIALLLGAGFCLFAINKEDKGDIATTEVDDKLKGNLTSSQELTTVKIPSRNEERARRDAELLAKRQEAEQKGVPIALDETVATPSMATRQYDENGKPMPTLEELKFQAPMMGEASGSSRVSNNSNNNSKRYDSGIQVPDFSQKEATPTHLRKDLASQLDSIATPQSYATKMGSRSMTLAKGTFIECILETRVDTSTPAMTSCVIPRDVYSQNGRVLLIERGTKAVGEYQGSVQNGLERIFMLWTELRTPDGIVVPLNSPTTDDLGAGGMGGWVDHHWWKRFGNALMFSMVADGFEYAVTTAQNNNNAGDVTYNNTNQGINEIIKAAMEQSGDIPPTLIKNQGERVGIFVARDLNFESVYNLRLEKDEF